jgi:hypothetical protein
LARTTLFISVSGEYRGVLAFRIRSRSLDQLSEIGSGRRIPKKNGTLVSGLE